MPTLFNGDYRRELAGKMELRRGFRWRWACKESRSGGWMEGWDGWDEILASTDGGGSLQIKRMGRRQGGCVAAVALRTAIT